jgi:hypothetical protein
MGQEFQNILQRLFDEREVGCNRTKTAGVCPSAAETAGVRASAFKLMETKIMLGITQEFNDINNITPSAKEWETEHTRVLDTHALQECKRWAASKALRRLSHDAAGHVQDILAEGIKLLLKTMTARLDDLQVQEHACRVLQKLGGNEQPDAQHSIRCIVAAGGISLLLQVLAAHKGSSAVLGQACGAKSNLARE